MPFDPDRRKSSDRRGAIRSEASGVLTISLANPIPLTFQARWIEKSATGFRVAHESDALEPGLEISFESAGRRGRARVVWTHVLDGHRTSGFVVL